MTTSPPPTGPRPATGFDPDRARPGDDGPRIATIDIGSNSLRLSVASLRPDGTYELIDDEKIVTRLARGTAASDRLDEEAIEETVAAVRTMKQIAEGYDVAAIRSVATCAVREASNRDRFLQRVREEADLEIEVIDGEEEARLAFASVDAAFDLGQHDSVAVVDIGGGSTEILLATGGIVGQVASMSIGAVRLTEATSELAAPRRLERMEHIVREHIRSHLGRPAVTPGMMIGTGGTFTAMGAMHRLHRTGRPSSDLARMNLRGERLHRADVRRLLERLHRMSDREREAVPGLNADRAEIIVAGVTIADTVMDRLGINELLIHDGGVRDGVLLELARDRGENAPASAGTRTSRLDAAREFARRCNRDESHSIQVEHLAMRIHDQIAAIPELAAGRVAIGGEQARELLQAAAILHDTGYYISYKRHHKHSYHLIIHSGLPGFRGDELAVIAAIARYHRRAMPKLKHAEFGALRPRHRTVVRELAAILRIAVGLDRAHASNVRDVRLKIARHRARFIVDSDRRPDADLFGANRKKDLFERVFDVEATFEWKPPKNRPADAARNGTASGGD